MASSSALVKRARSPQSAAVAGIAFLWFIGVIRFRLGALEDKLFATVFLGSALLFICMLLAAGAVMGTLLTLSAQPAGASDDIARMSGALTSALLATFGTRKAAVFVAPPGVVLIQLLFPAWVLILSVDILIRTPTDPR